MGMIVETVVVVLLVGLSVYLYLSNSSLSAKVNSLTSQTGSSASQVSSLTNQVSALTQQTSNLTSQVASLSASDTDLATNLAFFVVPANATATMAGSVNGTVQGFAGAYSFLTDQGVKLVVKNSADPNVIAVLNPIVGKTAQITGTFAPGTKLFTVSALNGMPVGETAAATTGAPATTTGTVASSTLAK
jgi:stage V sporulation protein SpoVS